VEIHNPFHDKTIRGIVINVAGKDPSSGEQINFDLFVPMGAGPLQDGQNQVVPFKLDSLNKPQSNTVVTLKEVHCLSEAPAAKEKHTAAN
jgi:hypothetical protein